MKLKQLLILGALLLSGSASAAIVDGVRQAPAMPEPIDAFTDGQTSMYMYNVGAGKFFCGGNAWGTQTSVSETGYRVYFEQYVPEGAEAWDGTTVLFKDSCLAKSGNIMNVFFDNVNGGCFVDRGSQANLYWKLEKNADNAYYRLSMAEANPNYQEWQVDTHPGTYWGWDAANGTVVSSFLNPANEGIHVDWAFCTIPAYDAYQVEYKVYTVAQDLKKQIDLAKEKGLDVAAQEAVYVDETASTEALEEAIAAVKSVIAKFEESNVDPNNPIDKTSMLANPDYTDGKTGWSDSNSDWAVSFNVAEHYDDTFNHYQDIEGAPAGVYALTLRGYSRPSSSGTAWTYYSNNQRHHLYLYASNANDTMSVNMPNIWVGKSEEALGVGSTSTVTDDNGQTWYVTNNMEGAEAYFGHEVYGPMYDVTLFFGLEGDSMRVGIRQDSKVGADWALWDNWRLTYYGGKAEAYQMWLDNLKANAPKFDADEVIATAGMIEAYNEAIEGMTATDYASVVAAMKAVDEQVALIEENVAAWGTYLAAIELANNTVVDPSLDPTSPYIEALAEYVEFDSEDVLDAMELDNAGIAAEVERLKFLIDEAVKKAVLPGADVTTYYLVNANFEDTSGAGWSYANGTKWTDIAGPANNKCMEAYEKKNFDIYQVVKGAPKGVYEISFNGFFRNGANDAAYAEYQAVKAEGGVVPAQAFVYVNNNQTPMKNCYDEEVPTGTLYSATEVYGPTPYVPGADSTGYWYANGMADAGTAFAQDMYRSYAYGIVINDGDELRLGVKGNLGTSVWAIWDNFKMIFRGNKPEVIKPLLEEAVANANLNLQKRVGKEITPMLNDAIAAGQAALGTGDGDEMFNALSGLFATNDTVNASVTAFDALYLYAESLFDAAGLSTNPTIIGEAMDLAARITENIDTREYATSEVEDLNKQIAMMLIRLKMPDYSAASDDNPADMTAVLENPDFGDYNGTNTAAGWDGAAGNLGNDDTQKAVLAYEYWQKTFDMSQTVIGGLPNGTYRIEVDGFSRIGSTDEDYNAYIANPDTLPASRALIYAWSTTDSLNTYREAPMKLIAAGLVTENLSDGSATFEMGGTTYYVPGDMVSSKAWMEAGLYKNVLYVDVTDGTLCLGMKKAEAPTSSWVVMDSWKLFYLGANSEFTGIQDVVAADGQVVSVSVYGANGAQLNGMKKGLNIIRTVYANGAVKVKKVMVK